VGLYTLLVMIETKTRCLIQPILATVVLISGTMIYNLWSEGATRGEFSNKVVRKSSIVKHSLFIEPILCLDVPGLKLGGTGTLQERKQLPYNDV
jgi:hypothetical protein